MTTVDIVDFLLARIGEDEAVAKAATPGPWDFADEHGLIPDAEPAWCVNQMRPGYEAMSETEGYIGDVAEVLWRHRDTCPDAEHIARYDPSRVLAECQTKRRMVELAAPWTSHTGIAHVVQIMNLRLLALPYATHPSYDETWRP